MLYEEKLEKLVEALNNADDSDVIQWWNERCSDCDMDDYVYENNDDEINELLRECDAMTAYRTIAYGDYHESDEYLCFNGYANFDSFNRLSDTNCPIDIDELADWLLENWSEEDITENIDVDFDED